MKGNMYYAPFLAAILLVSFTTGPATISATTTDLMQQPPPGITNQTNQTQTIPQEGTVRVDVGKGSNITVQYYTFSPQSVEINAGESVTWFSSAEFAEFHTVTFVLNQNLRSDILLPFAVPGTTNFELLPPFNAGHPIVIPAPDGRQAILAANKDVFYPTVIDANNQTTYLNGTESPYEITTDIGYAQTGAEWAINSGIIVPPMVPLGGGSAADQNSTATGTEEIAPGAPATDETTIIAAGNATTTTDVLTAPEELEALPQATFPLVNSFTVTFEQPGTYQYFCALHPWMTGQVIVHGEEEAVGGAEVAE
jgi:plastocyanin